MLLRSGATEDSKSPLDRKEIKPVDPTGKQPKIFIRRTVAELKLQYFGHLKQTADLSEKNTLMLRRIEGKGEKGGRGWDVSVALLTHWTWIWANSGRRWRKEEPSVLQSMRSQRVRHDLAIKQHQPVKVNLGTGLVNKDSRQGPTWWTGRGCFCMFATSVIFWVVLDVWTCRVGDSDFFFLFATLQGTWNLSSQTRDWTYIPCIGSTVLSTGPSGKSQEMVILYTWLDCEAVPSSDVCLSLRRGSGTSLAHPTSAPHLLWDPRPKTHFCVPVPSRIEKWLRWQ